MSENIKSDEMSEVKNENGVILDQGKLNEEDLPRLVEKIYRMLMKELRLEREREGRLR